MKREENFLNKDYKKSPHLIYVATLPWESLKFKFIQNYRNELCKSYDIDTNETFIVTQLNDKPLNIVTTFVQSVHPSPAHKHEDGHATRQLHCQ